ncbi:hypothetical protein OQA88_11630 [Cercophora sp. LCS_1]
MSPTGDSGPTHWAVLIGVGVNIITTGSEGERSRTDRSLRGADQDVVAVAEHLRTYPSPTDIVMLRVARTSYDDVCGRPTEAQETLPTYDNVCSSLKRVIALGKRNHHVYIHFSGHGTRRPLDGAVALALFDPGHLGTRYLYGSTLRSALQQMTELGMHVTLVLDCCFAGSALRGNDWDGAGIRFMEYDDGVDARSDYDAVAPDSMLFGTNRGSEIKFSHLLDPETYVIFSACGPDESAWEIEFEGGTRRGALSYFLVDSLVAFRRRRAHVTDQLLHQHIQTAFRARYSRQTPMLYGKGGLSFFEKCAMRTGESLTSAYREFEGDGLVLSAGQAHGVHKGDLYLLYPALPSEPALDSARLSPLKVVVDEIGSLTSKLSVADSSEAHRINKGSSWNARLVASRSSKRILVRLDIGGQPSAAATSLQHHPYLEVCAVDSRPGPPVFHVSVTDQRIYEIRDSASKRVEAVPQIAAHAPGDSEIWDVLGHLTTFKFFEGLENPCPNPVFEQSFLLHCDCAPGPDGYLNVTHGRQLPLSFQNLDDQSKYITIFNFKSSWEVRNLTFEAGQGEFLVVMPESELDSGEMDLPLKMTVEPQRGGDREGTQQTTDTLRIFVTSRPTAFPAVILPPLGHSRPRHELEGVERLINSLTCDPGGLRHQQESSNDWAIRTFFVRTTR